MIVNNRMRINGSSTSQSTVKPGIGSRHRLLVLGLALLVLVVVMIASLGIGARAIAPGEVIAALRAAAEGTGGGEIHEIVLGMRLPRAFVGVLVGAALGVSGALIQALTRNPLADTGVLGVNAGAGFLVTVGIGWFSVGSINGYIWFAFIGAAAATLVVFTIGAAGPAGATPIRLTLVGVALGAILSGASNMISLVNPKVLDGLRFWGAGSLASRDEHVFWVVLPFVVVGLVLAGFLAVPLNAIALGEDRARALGAHVGRTRALVVVAVTLLAGAATAAAGPIGFVGLIVPHVVRWIVGPDQRWIIVYCMVFAPILLLVADIIGRVVVTPQEMQVGIVTAFVGAPVLVLLARRRKTIGL